jgi:hypothetical protein
MNLILTLFTSLLPLFGWVPAVSPANDYPERTAVFKSPDAADHDRFFSAATVYVFELYKAGSAADLKVMLDLLRKETIVESCLAGKKTGDYQQVTLTLKNKTDKHTFIRLFTRAGIGHVKINQEPVAETGAI